MPSQGRNECRAKAPSFCVGTRGGGGAWGEFGPSIRHRTQAHALSCPQTDGYVFGRPHQCV